MRSGRTCDPVFRHGSRPVGSLGFVPPEVVQMLLHGRFPPDGEAASCFLPGVGEPSVPEVGPPEGSEVDEGHASEAEAEEEEVPCEGEVGFGVEVESCQTLETGGIQGAFGGWRGCRCTRCGRGPSGSRVRRRLCYRRSVGCGGRRSGCCGRGRVGPARGRSPGRSGCRVWRGGGRIRSGSGGSCCGWCARFRRAGVFRYSGPVRPGVPSGEERPGPGCLMSFLSFHWLAFVFKSKEIPIFTCLATGIDQSSLLFRYDRKKKCLPPSV